MTASTGRPRRVTSGGPLVAALVLVLALSSCGGADEPAVEAVAPTTATPTSTTAAPATAVLRTTTTSPATSTPASTAATTPTTTTPGVSTEARQATQPIVPPTDPYATEPVVELGRIAIPTLGVDTTMYEGIRMTTLDRGPGHWPGSAMPGAPGNVVVGGHRTSANQVFRDVDQLVVGDEVVFTDTSGVRHVYAVREVTIVEPTDVWIVDPTDTPTATLFACHPPGSTAQRIVVFADLVTG